MSESAFDTMTRSTAGALSRRGPLVALGGAALVAALSGAVATEAAQSKAKKVKKKDKKRCNQAREACESIVRTIDADEEELQILLACCVNCRAGDFISCFEAASPNDDMKQEP
jgi:hypothetical protein